MKVPPSFSIFLRQLARYALVGIGSNLLGYGLYLLISANWLEPKITLTVLYPFGILISYLGNRNFTFRNRGRALSSGARYLVVYAFGYLLNLSLIFWFVDRMGFPHQIVQGIAIFVVALVLFIMLRFLVFSSQASVNHS